MSSTTPLQALPPEILHIVARFYCRSIPSTSLFSSLSRKFAEVVASGLVHRDLILNRWPGLEPHLLDPSVLSYRDQLNTLYFAELSSEFSPLSLFLLNKPPPKLREPRPKKPSLKLRFAHLMGSGEPPEQTPIARLSGSEADLVDNLRNFISTHISQVVTARLNPVLAVTDAKSLVGNWSRLGDQSKLLVNSFGKNCSWFAGRFCLFFKRYPIWQYRHWNALFFLMWKGPPSGEDDGSETVSGIENMYIVPRLKFLLTGTEDVPSVDKTFDRLQVVRMDRYIEGVNTTRRFGAAYSGAQEDFTPFLHEKLYLWAIDGVLDLPEGNHFKRVVQFLAQFEMTIPDVKIGVFLNDVSTKDGEEWYQNPKRTPGPVEVLERFEFRPGPEGEIFRRSFYFALVRRYSGGSGRTYKYGKGLLAIGKERFLFEMHVMRRIVIRGRCYS